MLPAAVTGHDRHDISSLILYFDFLIQQAAIESRFAQSFAKSKARVLNRRAVVATLKTCLMSQLGL
jgi:hypothetical protein